MLDQAVSHQYPLVKRTTFTVLSVMIMVAPCKRLFFGCISLMLVCFVYVFNIFILIGFNISIFSLDKRKKIQTYPPLWKKSTLVVILYLVYLVFFSTITNSWLGYKYNTILKLLISNLNKFLAVPYAVLVSNHCTFLSTNTKPDSWSNCHLKNYDQRASFETFIVHHSYYL